MRSGADRLAAGLRALQGLRLSSDVPRSPLEAELDILVARYGEAEVAAVFKARRKKPLGRPSGDHLPYLLEMARTIAIAAPSRASLPGKRRAVDKEISLAAKRVAVGTPQYDATHRKDVAKTLRQKFKKVVHGPSTNLAELFTKCAILWTLIIGERSRLAPFKDHPDVAAMFTELESMEAVVVDCLTTSTGAILRTFIIRERVRWTLFKDHPDVAAVFTKLDAIEALVGRLEMSRWMLKM
jgi:hypothetical protein